MDKFTEKDLRDCFVKVFMDDKLRLGVSEIQMKLLENRINKMGRAGYKAGKQYYEELRKKIEIDNTHL